MKTGYWFINNTTHNQNIKNSLHNDVHNIFIKSAIVSINGLIHKCVMQLDTLHQPSHETLEKTEKFMSALDTIKFGRSTIHMAAEGYRKPWVMRA